MSINCEECGKLYHIPPDKIEKIRSLGNKFKCKECGHIIILKDTDGEEELSDKGNITEVSLNMEDVSEELNVSQDISKSSETSVERNSGDDQKSEKKKLIELSGLKFKGFGLRGKMLILFLIIPLMLMSGLGFFSQQQMEILTGEINKNSIKVVKSLAEENIAAKVRSVALQCRIFLYSHPEILKEDFNYSPDFKRIVVQNIGETGSTFLGELPDTKNMSWKIWAHMNPMFVGKDFITEASSSLGSYKDKFWQIIEQVVDGKEPKGYYSWQEDNKKITEKFIVCSKIEGTSYVVACTTNVNEFTHSIKIMEDVVKRKTINTRNINLLILVGALVIMGLTISIYAYKLTKNINYLTDAADRISVGELDAEIKVTSKDEIGNLADAISRMQDSLRFSMERLRRRR
ncbi:MAG: zinc-ribbon domain-containing protein [Desulfobacterales bacterium]|nr:zinc-ribbon domain-containing protein [Desulfobacterales bacterium]